jgi:dihydroneopterin triphosphate diphosphatase
MTPIVTNKIEVHVYRMRDHQPEFLVLHRAPGQGIDDTWHAVYGTVEPGESGPQAALRELREETAQHPSAFYQLDTVNTFYVAAEDAIYHNRVFVAQIEAGAEIRLNHEHDNYEWLEAEAAKQRFLWPGQRRGIDEILSEIITDRPSRKFLEIPL